MTTRLERVLAVVNHPGGINAVVPVVQRLMDTGVQCEVMTVPERAAALTRLGLRVCEVRDSFEFDPRPDVLLLGTSVPDPRCREGLEVRATIAARAVGIPTLAVLDYWAKYEGRFQMPGRALEECVPDRIAVMDSRAAEAMRGFPAGTVVVTGNPHWERLAQRHPPLTAETRARLRTHVGVNPGDRLILFISQAIESSIELEALRSLVAVAEDAPHTIIGIRAHPREDGGKFGPFLSPRVRLVPNDENIYDLGLASDARVGIHSTTLFEYSLLGLSALSYQPTLLVPQPDGVTVVASREKLRSRLFTAPTGHYEQVPNATENVVRLLDALARGTRVPRGPKQSLLARS